MDTFKIISNPETYEESLQSIYGEIYFEIEGICFPHKDWGDFVDTCLGTWIRNMLECPPNERFKCCFFDGPYYFVIEQNSIELYDHDKRVARMEPFFQRYFVEQIVAITRQLINCEAIYDKENVTRLETDLEALESRHPRNNKT